MKRYRWLNFYIDTARNIFKMPGVSPEILAQQKQRSLPLIELEYGSEEIEEKFARWLSINPPDLCVPVEYHELLREVEGAYIRGDFYPALTGACCLGERILNHLILGLRDEHRISAFFKRVYRKQSIDDWSLAIKALKDWNVINDNIASDFLELLQLRRPSVHFGDVKARAADSLKALNLTYKITDSLFGLSNPRFFIDHGEIYLKKDFESDPLTRLFIIPHCFLVGFKYEIKAINGENRIVDNFDYPKDEISDDDFVKGRNEFLKR